MTRPTWTRLLTDARKLGAALLGVLAIAATVAASPALLDVLPDRYARWAPVVIALASAVGVYRAKNAGTVTPDELAGRLNNSRQASYALGRIDQAAGRPPRWPTKLEDAAPPAGPPSVWLKPPPEQRKGPSHL